MSTKFFNGPRHAYRPVISAYRLGVQTADAEWQFVARTP